MRIYRTVAETVEMSGRTRLFRYRSMGMINVVVQWTGSDGLAKVAGRTLLHAELSRDKLGLAWSTGNIECVSVRRGKFQRASPRRANCSQVGRAFAVQ
jgi:hypothetical protein